MPCVVDLAAMRSRDEAGRWRSAEDQSSHSRRSGDRSQRCRLTSSAASVVAVSRTARWNSTATCERYEFLKWGQKAFRKLLSVVPPATGIVHQVNLEYSRQGGRHARRRRLPRFAGRHRQPYHDDQRSRRCRLGGRCGIEAEACMLGQPIYMVTPEVVGFKLHGQLARRLHRDRPGADRSRRSSAVTASSKSLSSSTATASPA